MASQFVVEDGTGLSNANSFTSEAYATQYNENHNLLDSWTIADVNARQRALRMATQFLVVTYANRWIGYRLFNTTQALPWPRYGVYIDGMYRLNNVIPAELQDATCELAFRYLQNITLMPDIPQGTGDAIDERVVIGPLEFETKYDSAASSYDLYTVVDRILTSLVTSGCNLSRG